MLKWIFVNLRCSRPVVVQSIGSSDRSSPKAFATCFRHVPIRFNSSSLKSNIVGTILFREAKRLIDASTETTIEDGLAAELEASVRIFATDDLLEGATAFLAKRDPEYRGS